MAADESQKQERGDWWSKDEGRKSSFRLTDGHLSFWKMPNWRQSIKSTKGRVVLRGDVVKDDSGAYAIFNEQGSSASQMTAAKVMYIISRLPGCSGQAADAVSAKTQVLTILKSECPDIWIRLPKHKWPKIMVQYGRSSRSSRKEFVRSPSGRSIVGKAIWESFIGTRLGKSFKLGMFHH